MARRTGSQNELIKCEYCGEMYSVTYKHCPFCNGDGTGRWDDPDSGYEDDYYDEDEAPRAKGGKRLAGGSGRGGGRGRGGPSVGRILLTVLSLALIVAAVCIVISIVKSMLDKEPAPDTDPGPAVSQSVAPAESVPAEESVEPVESAPAESGAVVAPPVETVQATPAVGAPTGFTLNREDFTFDAAGQIFQMRATYTPEGTSGTITWKSSDPNVASVSWNGVVTAVSQGTVTLTATVDGVGERTCIVRCNFKDAGAAASQAPAGNTQSPAASASPSTGGLSLNREDFTLSSAGETFRMIVKGTGSAVTWTSSNTAVATIGADGTVTAVGKGSCTVTATVDGVTLKCIVRCSF